MRNLTETTLKRWIEYLKNPNRDHKFLEPWDKLISERADRAKVQTICG